MWKLSYFREHATTDPGEGSSSDDNSEKQKEPTFLVALGHFGLGFLDGRLNLALNVLFSVYSI
jgi:hypothetical protein